MRPERLELEGFTAFRDRVELDFADAELFALVGPTGSGKSSIVDAITFALYGSVPRLPKGRVAPIVSLGAERARVRFEFSVAGHSYTAIRVVQRTKTGATTHEARLEGGDADVVGADQLTMAVEGLLGLSFEHFTKSVVLPQGEFASFLLDGPKDRQALLRELLNLGRYGRVRELAKERQSRSQMRAEGLRDQLKQLESVTPEAVDSLSVSVDEFKTVQQWMVEHQGASVELDGEIRDARQESQRLSALAKALRLAAVPDQVGPMAEEIGAARVSVTSTAAALEAAQAAALVAKERVESAGDPAVIAAALGVVEQLESIDTRIEKGLELMTEAETEQASVRSRLEGPRNRTGRGGQGIDRTGVATSCPRHSVGSCGR